MSLVRENYESHSLLKYQLLLSEIPHKFLNIAVLRPPEQ